MSVPNHQHVPKKLFDTGLFDLRTEEGQGAFTDAVVAVLHGLDEKWGHLKKNPGQSQVHGHGEDSALYLSSEPGQSTAVDFIGGAGGPNPQPGWIVDAPRYSAKDWVDPFDHKLGAPVPPPTPQIPSYGQLGDDAFFRAMIGVPLFADYLMADAAGHPDAKPNDGMSVWFSRPIYLLLAAFMASNGQPVDVNGIVRRVRNEWREKLRLPPV